jgi:hypothetical protein
MNAHWTDTLGVRTRQSGIELCRSASLNRSRSGAQRGRARGALGRVDAVQHSTQSQVP